SAAAVGAWHPYAVRGLVEQTAVDVLEPRVPPAERLVEEPDRRPRGTGVRIEVAPRADQSFARDGEPGQQAGDPVGVRGGPPADGVQGTGDAPVVLAPRAVPPVGVAPLVAEPELGEEDGLLEALDPGRAPRFAHERWVGGERGERVQDRAPGEVLVEE